MRQETILVTLLITVMTLVIALGLFSLASAQSSDLYTNLRQTDAEPTSTSLDSRDGAVVSGGEDGSNSDERKTEDGSVSVDDLVTSDDDATTSTDNRDDSTTVARPLTSDVLPIRDMNREELKEHLRGQKETLKSDVEERKAHFRALRTAAVNEEDGERGEIKEDTNDRRNDKNDRIEAFYERVFRRISAAFERLVTLADRIESRIAKMEERGFNLERATEALQSARLGLALIPEEIERTRNLVKELLAAEANRKGNLFSSTKIVLEGVKTSLKEVHAKLVEAVVNIKAVVDIPPRNDNEGDSDNESGNENNSADL